MGDNIFFLNIFFITDYTSVHPNYVQSCLRLNILCSMLSILLIWHSDEQTCNLHIQLFIYLKIQYVYLFQLLTYVTFIYDHKVI